MKKKNQEEEEHEAEQEHEAEAEASHEQNEAKQPRDANSINEREEELNRREEELNKREAQLEQRVSQVIKLGGEDNWPSRCYPIAYHDISKEIPEEVRSTIRKLYVLVIFTWICLIWNWMIMMAVWFSGGSVDASSDSIWSSLYMVLGIPLSWRWWYRGAYYGARDRSSKQWVSHFTGFFCHFVLSVLIAFGIPSCNGAGLLWMIKLFTNSYQALGVLSLICTCIWGLNLLFTLYLFRATLAIWRKRGGSEQLTRDVTKAAIDSELRAVNISK